MEEAIVPIIFFVIIFAAAIISFNIVVNEAKKNNIDDTKNENDFDDSLVENTNTKFNEIDQKRVSIRSKNEKILNEADAFPSERLIPLIGYQTRLLIGVNTKQRTVMLYTDNSLRDWLSDLKYLSFDNIIDCTTETVTSTTASKQNEVGRAVVGGILAGGAGAVVGAATAKTSVDTNIDHMILNIYTNDILNPLFTFTATTAFNTVQEAYALFRAIIANNQSSAQRSYQAQIPRQQNVRLPDAAGQARAIRQPGSAQITERQSTYTGSGQQTPYR